MVTQEQPEHHAPARQDSDLLGFEYQSGSCKTHPRSYAPEVRERVAAKTAVRSSRIAHKSCHRLLLFTTTIDPISSNAEVSNDCLEDKRITTQVNIATQRASPNTHPLEVVEVSKAIPQFLAAIFWSE